jgi:hypothetical protein
MILERGCKGEIKGEIKIMEMRKAITDSTRIV